MKKALKAAGLIAAAVVLGLLTTQGSYALWNSMAPSNAGTIQAADFSILVNGAPVAPDGTFSLTPVSVSPGSPVTSAVTITNNANVTQDSPFLAQPKVAASVGETSPLSIQMGLPGVDGTCSKPSFPITEPLPAMKAQTARTVCIQTAIKPGTSTSQLGGQASVKVDVTMTQLPVQQPTAK